MAIDLRKQRRHLLASTVVRTYDSLRYNRILHSLMLRLEARGYHNSSLLTDAFSNNVTRLDYVKDYDA